MNIKKSDIVSWIKNGMLWWTGVWIFVFSLTTKLQSFWECFGMSISGDLAVCGFLNMHTLYKKYKKEENEK
jgi:hypothetical protein